MIDDFGRQAMSPAALLNRWIVPLENRVDYLTLQTGQKIDFPFLAMIVFNSSLQFVLGGVDYYNVSCSIFA